MLAAARNQRLGMSSDNVTNAAKSIGHKANSQPKGLRGWMSKHSSMHCWRQSGGWLVEIHDTPL